MSLRPWSRFLKPQPYRAHRQPARKHSTQQPARRRLVLEQLEDRNLMAGNVIGNATVLSLLASNVVRVTDFIDTTNNVDMFSVQLNQGDRATVDLNAQSMGSGLNSYLRVFFDPDGAGAQPVRQIAANDDFDGRDARLTFQAQATGTYYLGISSAGNEGYNPVTGAGVAAGTTHGLFELVVTRQHSDPTPKADLVGAVFEVSQDTAATDDPVTITYRIENRGGETTVAGFRVEFFLSANSFFEGNPPSSDISLGTVDFDPLDAGASTDSVPGTLRTFLVPNLPAFVTGEAFIGMRIDSTGVVAESNETNNDSQRRGSDWDEVRILVPVNETAASNDVPLAGQLISLDSQVSGSIASAGDIDYYHILVTQAGRLTAEVRGVGIDTRLSLFAADGTLLIQSDAQSSEVLDDLIVQHLKADIGGTLYILKVENPSGTSGSYQLNTQIVDAVLPFTPLNVGDGPISAGAADFNGDGLLDFATGNGSSQNVSIYLGLGDGSFRPELVTVSLGQNLAALTIGDFNGDEKLDLVAAGNFVGSGNLWLFLGNGDGTFQNPTSIGLIGTSTWVTTGDFNNDQLLDIALMDRGFPGIRIYLGLGNGTFQNLAPFFAAGVSIDVDDFNGDGLQDLVTAGNSSPDAWVFLGQGNGAFDDPIFSLTGGGDAWVISGDWNRDGIADVITANNSGDTISFLSGNNNGTFDDPVLLPTGDAPRSLVRGDFNGDGWWDVAVGNDNSDDIAVLLGQSNGTLAAPVHTQVQVPGRFTIIASDFDDSGLVDLIFVNELADVINQSDPDNALFLLGLGDGTFQNPRPFAVGDNPTDMIAADFNGDGRLDLATTNAGDNGQDVSILLGQGDGTLQAQLRFPAGLQPMALAAGDFNRDGRIDLAVAVNDLNGVVNDGVMILLGLGDGAFTNPQRFEVGFDPFEIVVADFNRDGVSDVAVSNTSSNTVSVLLGQGDGTLGSQLQIPVGTGPYGLVAAYLNADNILDLAVANRFDNSLTILFGTANGSFDFGSTVTVGSEPTAVVAGDWNADTIIDLAVSNFGSDDVSILQGTHSGNFSVVGTVGTGDGPIRIAAAGLNGDTLLDLVTINALGGDAVLLNNQGNFNFTTADTLASVSAGVGMVADDFNADNAADLALLSQRTNDITVLLASGNSFIEAGVVDTALVATPVVADFTSDGVPDVAVLRRDGRIILRPGLAGQVGVFGVPLIVNAPPIPFDPSQDFPARDFAPIVRNGQWGIAALNSDGSGISLYTFSPLTGVFDFTAGPDLTAGTPVRIAAANLTDDNLDTQIDSGDRMDLVISAAGSNQLLVFLQNVAGGFSLVSDHQLDVGLSPLAIQFADMDGDDRADIVVTNQFSGDMSIVLNSLAAPFATELRYRAGSGLFGMDTLGTTALAGVHSRLGTVSVVAGQFDLDGNTDLIAVNSGSHSFAFLQGTGDGGLFNPNPLEDVLVGGSAIAAATARFDQDADLDLAFLDREHNQIVVFSGNGAGGFQQGFTIDAGSAPSGLSVGDVNDDSFIDLLIGNEFGDVLIILGNGDGTFRPFQRAGQNIPLGVTMVNGQEMVVMGNQSLDRVSLALPDVDVTDNPAFQDRENGIQGPENVQLALLNNDLIPDLVVANGGSNNVLIYLGLAGGGFGPEINDGDGFFTGTNPVGITVANVNPDQDDFLDLVVTNRGSNDITILLGNGDGTFRNGPRLVNAGVDPDTGAQVGFAPTSTVVEDVDGDGTPDILVSFRGSDNVGFIQGAGAGAFRDNQTSFTDVGGGPGSIISLADGRFASLNFSANSITILSSFANNQFQRQDVATRGFGPSSALAGDFNGDGGVDLLVGSSGDGLIELFLDDGGELLASGFLDTELNISAMALSVIEGSRVFYVTSDGVEQAFAFTLDQFIGEERGTVADLTDSTSVAIIAALVAGSGELDGADLFGGSDGETVSFGELLFFSGDGAFEGGTGAGGYTPAEALARLQALVQQFVQEGFVAFTAEGAVWGLVLDVSRDVLYLAAAAPEQAAEVFGCWRTVVSHLRLTDVGQEAVDRLLAAGSSWMQASPLAGAEPDGAALVDAAFRDGFLETAEIADVLFQETLAGDPAALPETCGATWQEWLPASLLACGLPGWLVREATQRDEQPRRKAMAARCAAR